MRDRLEREWSELVEQVLADPRLTEVEAKVLEGTPDLFKANPIEFEAATLIVEKSLIRRGWIQPLRVLPPTYH
jgi:hypothetical protein